MYERALAWDWGPFLTASIGSLVGGCFYIYNYVLLLCVARSIADQKGWQY